MSQLVTDAHGAERAIRALRSYVALKVDLETTGNGLYPFAKDNPARVAGAAIGPAFNDDPSLHFYLSFRHAEGDNVPLEFLPELLALLRGKTLLNHNLGFDLRIMMMERLGFELPPRVLDSMVAAHLANENEPSFGLKKLSAKLFGDETIAAKTELDAELKRRKLKMGQISQLPASLVYRYAIDDILLADRLHANRLKELERWRLTDEYAEKCEFLLAVTRMELRGITLDQEECHKQIAQLAPKMRRAEGRLHEIFTERGIVQPVNIKAPKQLAQALRLPKTARQFLEDIQERDQREDVRLVLDWRSLFKAESSFFLPYLQKVGADGRLHSSFNVARTVTHRLASREPNLQQCSRDQGNRAYSVRKCLVAASGHFLLEADYSTVEPRLAAHYARDEVMLELFRTKQDYHTGMARQIYHKQLISKDERTSSKVIGLGLMYFLGATKAAIKLGLRHEKAEDGSYEYHYEPVWAMLDGELQQVPCSMVNAEFCTCEGRAFIKRYYAAAPGLQPTIKAVNATAERNKYIRVPLAGWVRRFDASKDRYYKAFNSLIQMSAAKMLIRTFLALDKAFTRPEDPQLILSVHDSIVFEIPLSSRAHEQAKFIKQTMESSTELLCPVVADCKIGPNLGNLGEL